MRAVKRVLLTALTLSLTAALMCTGFPATASGVEAVPTKTPVRTENVLPPRVGPTASVLRPMGTIWIARINLKMSIYRGNTPPIFKKGVGWYPGTALPGRSGNVVLGGHRVTWPEPFRHIDAIKVGDRIVVKYRGKRYTYIVYLKKIVKPKDTWILKQNVAQPRLTLFACHPLGRTTHRYVVFATLKKK